MSYPRFRRPLSGDELVDHFTLDFDERDLVGRVRKRSSRLGLAVLLKTSAFLGYPPARRSHVPPAVVARLAKQLGLSTTLFDEYKWKSRQWRAHVVIIREHTGFRPAESKDHPALLRWLSCKANEAPSRKDLFAAAVQRCRECRLELPKEKELRRLVNAARRSFFGLYPDLPTAFCASNAVWAWPLVAPTLYGISSDFAQGYRALMEPARRR